MKQYTPLFLVLIAIITLSSITYVAIGLQDPFELMRLFMGYFFLLFSGFKFLDLKGFVMAFREYDTIGRFVGAYAWSYPFIELALALLYLTNTYPLYTNIATAIVMFTGSVGVIRAVTSNQKIHCACLGAVIKLPMSTITIIEDVGMGLMALAMLSRLV